MARPDDDNEFGLRDVRAPVQRALAIEKRHAPHSTMERVWQLAERTQFVIAMGNPMTMPSTVAALSLDPRFRRVMRAVAKSLDSAATLMLDESLDVGQGLIAGIVPMLGNLALWGGAGALIGGGIGAVGGLGLADAATIPGGIFFGFEMGLLLGGFWALKDLLMEASKRLGTFITYAVEGAELAWYAGEDRTVSVEQDVNAAAKLFAVAISELWWVILQAIILWVMKRAGEIAAKAGAKAIAGSAMEQAIKEARVKSAKFGNAFGEWFEKNFERIKESVERRQKALREVREGDGGGSPEGSSSAGGHQPKASAGLSGKPVEPAISPMDSLADRRKALGLPAAGMGSDDATLARLDINGKSYEGINRGYQDPKTPISLDRVNAQTATHAEADAVQQALNDGAKGSSRTAEMWIDRDPCKSCGQFGGLRSLARNLGVDQLIVHSPSGTTVFTPTK